MFGRAETQRRGHSTVSVGLSPGGTSSTPLALVRVTRLRASPVSGMIRQQRKLFPCLRIVPAVNGGR